MKETKKKKSILKIINKLLVILILIFVLTWSGLCYLNYKIDVYSSKDGAINTKVLGKKKKELNVLVCGQNQLLTDTMIYLKYNTETGKLAFMSIPRDTYVNNEYCVGHKLNAIYRGKYPEELVKEIENLLDVDIDYYAIIDQSVIERIVDEIGGIEIDVGMRMLYDDPTQNLHINLEPGVQVLNGNQAVQYIRFRKNNDGTGYAMGDMR